MSAVKLSVLTEIFHDFPVVTFISQGISVKRAQ